MLEESGGKPHPNIFELIKVIKKEEATTWIKNVSVHVRDWSKGGPPRRRKEREKVPDSL